MILKLLSAAAAVLALTAQQSAAQFTVTLPDREVTVESSDGTANFKGAPIYGEPGQPSLPGYKVTFLLPEGVDPKSISITIENPIEEVVRGTFNVKPALPPTVRGEINRPAGKNISNGMDMDVYGNDAFFPADFKGVVTFAKIRQYQLVDVIINPFRYNPVTHQLKRITGGTLSVTLPEDAKAPKKNASPNKPNTKKTDGKTEKLLRKKAVNPEVIDSYLEQLTSTLSTSGTTSGTTTTASSTPAAAAQAVNDGDGYAIITTNALVAASTQLQNLIDQKAALGYDVILATENIWGGGTGDAAAENIRAWLQQNYLSNNIQFVLLIGNPDPTTGDVPMKMCWPRLGAFTYPQYQDAPTDFYYAELSGNWDINSNGYFGEGYGNGGIIGDFGQPNGPDVYAEVAVGRIPYYGSIVDLDKILAKSINYASATSRSWRNSVLLPMIASDEATPGFNLGEEIKNNYLSTGNWKSFRIYDLHNDFSGEDIEDVVTLTPTVEHAHCNYTDVEGIWKGNPFGLVIWWTHGSQNDASDIFSSYQSQYLNDNFPSMTFQISCLNAYPEEPANLAYTLLTNGAVSTVGATRVSWYAIGQTDFLNSGTNSGMGYTYGLYMTRDEMTTADALNAVKSDIMNVVEWMNFLVFNVYGCPDLTLEIDNAAPTQLRTLAKSASSIQISWTDTATAEAGFCIERATANGNFTEIATIPPNVSSYIDNGLTANTKYHYRVRTYYYPSGTSDYSNVDSTSTYANLAPGKMYDASSQLSGNISELAIDNNTSTRWSASNGTMPQWFKVDLCGNYELSGCEIIFERPGTPGDCYDYVISVSSDNQTWSDVVNANPNTNQSQTQSVTFQATARYVRITIYGASYYYYASMYEFRVFGPTVPKNPTWNAPVPSAVEGQLQLSWTPSGGATSYSIYQTQPGQPRFVIASGLKTSSFTTTGLVGGKDYIFSVVAHNAAGHSTDMPQAVDLLATAPLNSPMAPTDLYISQKNFLNGYLLDWENNPIYTDGFEIERRAINTSTWSVIATTTKEVTEYFDMSVNSATSYEYRVRAFNTQRYSNYSEIVSTLIPPTTPIMVSTTYEAAASTATLTWRYGNSTHTGVRLERSTDNGVPELIATLGPSVTTYINTVEDNHIYNYQLSAFNDYGNSDYVSVSVATTPFAPSELTATLNNPTEVILTWTDNAYPNPYSATPCKIEQAIGNGVFSEIGYNYTMQSIYTVSSLSPSTTYRFRVCAYNQYSASGYITSGYSNIVTITTPPVIPAAPSGLVATANSRSKITLTWVDNSSNESGFYIERATASAGPFTRLGPAAAGVKTFASTNLTANTAYWYRVYAYNAGGNSVYSGTVTTTTHTNLSLSGTATAQSAQSGNAIANAKDNNTGTRWAASSSAMPQWWKIDLGSSKTISEVEIMFERAGTTDDCNNFKVETSTNNTTWTSRVDKTANTNTAQTQSYAFSATARYVRITISGAPGTYYASMFEFRVFGK